MKVELSITEDGQTEIVIVGEKGNAVIYADHDCIVYISGDMEKVVVEA